MSACARGRGGEGRGEREGGVAAAAGGLHTPWGKKKKEKNPVRVRESTKRMTGFRLPTYRQEREVLRAGFVSQPGSGFFVCLFFLCSSHAKFGFLHFNGPILSFSHLYCTWGETSSPLESVKSQVTFAREGTFQVTWTYN